jgi:excisionase family DNA binding protein
LKALADDLRQYSPDRLKAFETMIENKDRPWLTADEVAEQLNVHRETVRRWIRGGQLKAVKAGRQHRIAPADLTDFLNGSDHAQQPASSRP